ncbi:MAG: hypothetical protein KI793_02445 [Rivularia sp. (in: Bacteria)]|nr:hypothetical protein [Rivularia sp. MS3]
MQRRTKTASGHGKIIVTAYLMGSQGTPKQAILLDLVTTTAHTASIFALGLLALSSLLDI